MSLHPNYWDTYIKKYIAQNATSAVIRKANEFFPTLIHNKKISDTEHKYLYSCWGASGNVYNISLTIKMSTIDEIHCTCPYDYSGMCKHTVAVLHLFAQVNSLKSSTIPNEIN